MKVITLSSSHIGDYKKGEVYTFEISGGPESLIEPQYFWGNKVYVASTNSKEVSLIFLNDKIPKIFELDSNVNVAFESDINIVNEVLLKEITYLDLKEVKDYTVLKLSGGFIFSLFVIYISMVLWKKIIEKRKIETFKNNLVEEQFEYIMKEHVENESLLEVKKYISKKIYQKNWTPSQDNHYKDLLKRVKNV